ncbi:MAG: hypothetical protein UE295_08800 [Acutalibacteraceae bacterium]|nr:hypothetical protein [Acutalibacteraceae bacterium]
MIDFDFLDTLINDVEKLRNQIEFREIDITKCMVSYMPTKKTSFVGYKQGYSDCLVRNEKGIKESDKIRANIKNYHKLIKDENVELIQIETYGNGRIDCVFQVHWLENTRYLFPFSANGGFYPTYVYATKFEDNSVVAEYMVQGSQIVYETYSYNSDNQVDYSCIHYVSGGNYPVREQRKGIFKLNPLTNNQTYYDCWLNHRHI